MGRFDLAIFDCDGVILDSREANRSYYNAILDEFGHRPMTDTELSFVHMHTAEESIRYLFKDYAADVKEALIYSRQLNYTNFLDHLIMEPGVRDTIESIRPPILTAISTNRSTTMPMVIDIFGLDKWFDIIVCALDVKYPKPNPEGIFKILNISGVDKDHTIYIGDSIVDETVSHRAGIPFIAYKNSNLNALFHVEHFFEIKEILFN
ncbi:MAG: hypothetical protein AVO38_09095 [delta proteobacterium ML8_D]|jgi:phosphoglycolate phosphatase|nr:MAG: hypothetical protein AVO38_09095 [delta proteobacterium ML8_D]